MNTAYSHPNLPIPTLFCRKIFITMKSTRSPLASLSPIFYALNGAAMTGWSYVLFLLLSQLAPTLPSIPLSFDLSLVTPVVIWLECICVVEVLRTALGDLPGNLVLGVVLHAIRFIAVLFVVPSNPNSWIAGAVLLSWAFTEVARYPMYLFPSSETCRSIRMVVPLATFPVGAIAEGYGAYLLFSMEDTASWLKAVLAGMIFVNGVLGPTMAYPALLKKGLPILGLGNEIKRGRSSKKRA